MPGGVGGRASSPPTRSKLTVRQWQIFGEALSKCDNLQELDLLGNYLHKLTAEQWQAFGEFLIKCHTLQELDLRGNYLHYLTTDQWQAFCEALSKCCNLQESDLDDSACNVTLKRWLVLNEVLNDLSLYRHFPEYKFTKYNKQYHQVARIKSQNFLEANNLTDNDGAQIILKFLSTKDVCSLAQVCRNLASKELNKFIKEYFKNLFMGLEHDALVNIRKEFLRDKEFVLDTLCEINNADKYNIDVKKIQEFIARFDSDDKEQISEALTLQNAKVTHLVKFYNSHKLYQILEDVLKLFFDFEEDLDIPPHNKRPRMVN
jgi:hypothetical protein